MAFINKITKKTEFANMRYTNFNLILAIFYPKSGPVLNFILLFSKFVPNFRKISPAGPRKTVTNPLTFPP